ncbi:hypothetical protein BW686_10025 [Pseudomonas syringae]|uniref:Uncharacterized protein n=1 Tax=Pseudomonas syringae TaxID=317 RepID=A0A244EV08_PSESX|nr:hypothetical protein BW686_10025 [Pseudomonas syringae]
MLYTRNPSKQQQAKHFSPTARVPYGGKLKRCGGVVKTTARRTMSIVLRQYIV